MIWERGAGNKWESEWCDWHIAEVIVEVHDGDGDVVDSYIAYDVYTENRDHMGRHYTLTQAKRYAEKYWMR